MQNQISDPMLTSSSSLLRNSGSWRVRRSDDTMWGIIRNRYVVSLSSTNRKPVGETALEQNFRMSIPHTIIKTGSTAVRAAAAALRRKAREDFMRKPENIRYVEVMKEGSEEFMKKQNLVTDGQIKSFTENGLLQKCRLWTLAKDQKLPVDPKLRYEKQCVKIQVFNHNMQPEMGWRCFPSFPKP